MRREVRAATVVALIAGAAALALHFGLRDTGIVLGAFAVAIAAAFYCWSCGRRGFRAAPC